MRPAVLRELADVVAVIFESHDSQVKSLVTGKREIFHPFLKHAESRTLGTTNLSASPLCLGGSWNRSS